MDLFRRMVEEWNNGNYEYLKAAFATDYAYYFPSSSPKPMSGEENIEEIRKIKEGFPDIIWVIEEMVAAGDTVIARSLFRGTHKGNYFGIAPTGNRIEVSSIMMVWIRNGKFVEKREELDALPLMLQLGMELNPKPAEKK